MNVKRWIARREPSWQQLEALLQKVEKKGLKSLSARNIEQMASLYRSVSADLARAQTQNASQTLVRELQNLTSRSYSQIYQGSRRQEWRSLGRFYRWGLPQVVQETWPYWGLATAMFLFGSAVGWWYSWRDPSFVTLVTSPELVSTVRDDGELWMGSILGYEPLASSYITINNLSVCFRAIAGGITGGLFTAFILVFNGLLIGSVSTLVAQHNLAVPFWGFVFPHGSLELPAIFLSGGAGLLIGRGLLFPGALSRGA
ncbi:MAG: stage II sporulation protein M, partial [Cyanobacteria bacterium J06639_1]